MQSKLFRLTVYSDHMCRHFPIQWYCGDALVTHAWVFTYATWHRKGKFRTFCDNCEVKNLSFRRVVLLVKRRQVLGEVDFSKILVARYACTAKFGGIGQHSWSPDNIRRYSISQETLELVSSSSLKYVTSREKRKLCHTKVKNYIVTVEGSMFIVLVPVNS